MLFFYFYPLYCPPLICIVWPVTYDESSLARYTNNGAISYVSPALFIGASAPSVGIFSASQQAGCSAVQKYPGATALTLIFLSAKFVDSALVKPMIAPLLVT